MEYFFNYIYIIYIILLYLFVVIVRIKPIHRTTGGIKKEISTQQICLHLLWFNNRKCLSLYLMNRVKKLFIAYILGKIAG